MTGHHHRRTNAADKRQEAKLPASTARVTRSLLVERGQVVVMNGDQFEDGRQRIVVGCELLPEHAHDLARILDERDDAQDRLDRLVASLSNLFATQSAVRCAGCDCEPVGYAPHNGKGDCPPLGKDE